MGSGFSSTFCSATSVPKEMEVLEIKAFLTHLIVEECVLTTTQNQARSALIFLYRDVLQQSLDAPN